MKKSPLTIAFAVLIKTQLFAQAPIISYATPQTYVKGTAINTLTPTNTGSAVTYGTVTTLAGNGNPGSADGTGSASSLFYPMGVAVDVSGNVYVADTYNDKIRKITYSGVVTTFAGNGYNGSADGISALTSFNEPVAVAIDLSGNVYVADTSNHEIRKITPDGVVTTLAGSGSPGSTDAIGTAASFYYPEGIAVDASGNVYVADEGNNKIRMITPSGVVSTLAGSGTKGTADGIGTAASFNSPGGVSTDASGNVYVADMGNNKIRKVTQAGVVSTLAGNDSNGSADGSGTATSFNVPTGVAVDVAGNVYVGDRENNKIRKITPAGVVSTLAGNGTQGSVDGVGTAANFKYPMEVAVDASGNVYVADEANHKIRKIDAVGGYTITPQLPTGLKIDASTGAISGTPTAVSPQTTYTITATNSSGTSAATVEISVNSVLATEDIAFKNMVVYPNPTTGEVNINNVVVEKVNVYNNAGQLVKTVTNPEASNSTTVQLNNLPTGVYYLHIETENAKTVKQVIKQ